nr:PREDICTED: fractalkine [Latimeria chalumnae]|eukprot:XP_014346555.1 PREDICTED: fractalkine [Latimeria chalumnae]
MASRAAARRKRAGQAGSSFSLGPTASRAAAHRKRAGQAGSSFSLGPTASRAGQAGSRQALRLFVLTGTDAPSVRFANICCFEFATKNLPQKLVVEYLETPAGCPKDGVIFVTKKGHNICVDPKSKHTQKIMKHLDKMLVEKLNLHKPV